MNDGERIGGGTAVAESYRVLARKYRPTTFSQLIGQDVLVRTLSNAFRLGRLAQAYMLSGVRGVGKTTTARIIARALNCVGPDGQGDIAIEPCGVCEHCRAIAEDRHLDVIEMDAASRTRVEEMRELLDGVRYRPAMARYKVYIIDEVHMLSAHSFNALLKTLEEPPEHVKFIFATTEIRKVPVTVLSRCQRFDLRRVESAQLVEHLRWVSASESTEVASEALSLIARAADGSVRDALSLLDQALARASGRVDEATVSDMLGLADRTVIFDILEATLTANPQMAIRLLGEQYRAGADPVRVFEDLLDLTHWLTRLKVSPGMADDIGTPEPERIRGRSMAGPLSVGALSRIWQLLLKGLGEVRIAPSSLNAAEMVLIRLAYTAQLPTPAETLGGARFPTARPSTHLGEHATDVVTPARSQDGGTKPQRLLPTDGPTSNASVTGTVATKQPQRSEIFRQGAVAARELKDLEAREKPLSLQGFDDVVTLARDRKEAILLAQLVADVHLVSFEPGHIELRLREFAPPDLPHRLSRFLTQATGRPWLITLSNQPGALSVREQRNREEAERLEQLRAHPLISAALSLFPNARIGEIRYLEPGDGQSANAEAEEAVGLDTD